MSSAKYNRAIDKTTGLIFFYFPKYIQPEVCHFGYCDISSVVLTKSSFVFHSFLLYNVGTKLGWSYSTRTACRLCKQQTSALATGMLASPGTDSRRSMPWYHNICNWGYNLSVGLTLDRAVNHRSREDCRRAGIIVMVRWISDETLLQSQHQQCKVGSIV